LHAKKEKKKKKKEDFRKRLTKPLFFVYSGNNVQFRHIRGGAMSARIRLKKFGTKKRPYYRIVVMDQRSPRDGKTIEELGYYHPIEAEDKQIVFDMEKAKEWLAKSATPSDTVRKIFNKKGLHVK
jgi:small subunit ribosomal protein S16